MPPPISSPKICNIKVKRCPILNTIQFRTCNLCYDRPNCCSHLNPSGHPIIIQKDYVYWNRLLKTLFQHQKNNDIIRVITERNIPREVVWASMYSAWNILQVNVNILQDWENIKWVVPLANLAEKCGIGCLLFIYPVLPIQVKTSKVLYLLDAVNSYMHCQAMIKFGEFINYGLPINSNSIKLMGVDTPLSLVHQLNGKGDLWGCSEEFKSQFMEYIKFYAEANGTYVGMCGGD